MNSVLKMFVIASLVVGPVAGFAADGAEALQRYHQQNKQRFHDAQLRTQHQTSIEKNKFDISQGKNQSAGAIEETDAQNELSSTEDGAKKK